MDKRIILFRGKRVDNGEWVYGSYYRHIARQICPVGDKLEDCDIKHLMIQSGFADWDMSRPLQATEVIPKTVGQFTGLTDKNGTKIFEGDRVSAWQVAHQAVGEVKCRIDGLWIIYPANQHGKLWGMSPNPKGETKLEVIGTIHD